MEITKEAEENLSKTTQRLKRRFFDDKIVDQEEFEQMISNCQDVEKRELAGKVQDSFDNIFNKMAETQNMTTILNKRINDQIREIQDQCDEANIKQLELSNPELAKLRRHIEELKDKKASAEKELEQLESTDIKGIISKIEDTEFKKRQFFNEKKAILDEVDEKYIRQLCKKNEFSFHYQKITLILVFQYIFKIDLLGLANEHCESKKVNLDGDKKVEDIFLAVRKAKDPMGEFAQAMNDGNFKNVAMEFIDGQIVDLFKKNCYDAWRFKNILVNLQDLNIPYKDNEELKGLIRFVGKLEIYGLKEVNDQNDKESVKKANLKEYHDFFKKVLHLMEKVLSESAFEKILKDYGDRKNRFYKKKRDVEHNISNLNGQIDASEETLRRITGGVGSGATTEGQEGEGADFNGLINLVNHYIKEQTNLFKFIGKNLLTSKDVLE